MTNQQVIDSINKKPFMKDANLVVNKIKFEGTKDGKNRRIVVYFKGHKYSAMTWVANDFIKLHQSQPVFGLGVDENDKDGWSMNVRRELLNYLFERFWIWMQSVDGIYNMMKNSHGWSDELIASHLIDRGYNRQYVTNPHMYKSSWDTKLNPKTLVDFFNEDVADGLYSGICNIEYPKDHKLQWMSYEELFNEKNPIGF